MPNTDEFWDVDGVSLHEYAHSISTLTGRLRMPSKRGGNQPVPYRDGEIWVPKSAEAQVISLAMWVLGTDADGVVSDDMRGLFNDNWRSLARLFWTENSLHTVTKRWRSAASGGLVTAAASAEIVEGIDVDTEAPGRGVFTVDLVLPDVYFFGVEVETIIPVGTTVVVENTGDATLRWMEVVFEGGLVNPQLTNVSIDPEVWVSYGGSIPDDMQVTLDTKTFTARLHPTLDPADTSNVIGAVSRSGSRYWMVLAPGSNSLLLTGTGDGHAIVRYRPPYF